MWDVHKLNRDSSPSGGIELCEDLCTTEIESSCILDRFVVYDLSPIDTVDVVRNILPTSIESAGSIAALSGTDLPERGYKTLCAESWGPIYGKWHEIPNIQMGRTVKYTSEGNKEIRTLKSGVEVDSPQLSFYVVILRNRGQGKPRFHSFSKWSRLGKFFLFCHGPITLSYIFTNGIVSIQKALKLSFLATN